MSDIDTEQLIEEQVYKAFTRVLEGEERKEGVHISNLKYDCLRMGYYSLTRERRYDLEGMLRMGFGTLIHEFELAENSQHEKPLDEDLEEDGWRGIYGTPDEYWEGIVIDKKTTTNPPDKGMRHHHRKQVEMYGAILDDLGYSPIGGAVVYIDLSTPQIVVKDFPLGDVDFDAIREEIIEKKTTLDMCLEVNSPPEREVGWICKYCDFVKQCFWDDVEDDIDG